MSDLRKAAEMALEALEGALSDDQPYIRKSEKAVEALRQALSQPEQKPVAWRNKVFVGDTKYIWNYTEAKVQDQNGNDLVRYEPLYTQPVDTANTSQERETAPPKRWVGLTDEEIYHFVCNAESYLECAKGMEAKLKEKNT